MLMITISLEKIFSLSLKMKKNRFVLLYFPYFFLQCVYCNSSAHWIRLHKNLVMVYHMAESLWLSDSIKVWNGKVQDSIPHKDYNFFLCLMLMTGQKKNILYIALVLIKFFIVKAISRLGTKFLIQKRIFLCFICDKT